MGYFNMNEIPIGTKIKVKNVNLIGSIVEIFHFPTTFKVEFEDGTCEVYKTHEIELVDNDEETNQRDE